MQKLIYMYIQLTSIDANDSNTKVTAIEVEGLVSKLKLCKAAGPSGIFSENIRYASKRLYIL